MNVETRDRSFSAAVPRLLKRCQQWPKLYHILCHQKNWLSTMINDHFGDEYLTSTTVCLNGYVHMSTDLFWYHVVEMFYFPASTIINSCLTSHCEGVCLHKTSYSRGSANNASFHSAGRIAWIDSAFLSAGWIHFKYHGSLKEPCKHLWCNLFPLVPFANSSPPARPAIKVCQSCTNAYK